MNWQERFHVRKKCTTEWYIEDVTFGMFGLYGRLGAFFNGFEAADKSRRLDRGEKVYIGDYEVFKEFGYHPKD